MISDPQDYRWSSYRCKAEGSNDQIVDFDTPYLSLGKNKRDRQAAYVQYVCDTIPEAEIKLMRDALQREQLIGSERFRQEVS